tara:strand:- start:3321 stop:3989 length:669 start_codon:yes stop_codon:yes gene_type:complete
MRYLIMREIQRDLKMKKASTDIVYNLRVQDSGPITKVAFNFDGRLKDFQNGVALYRVEDKKVDDFTVKVVRKGNMITRVMKACVQKDIMISQLERYIPKMLAGQDTPTGERIENEKENVSGTDSGTDLSDEAVHEKLRTFSKEDTFSADPGKASAALDALGAKKAVVRKRKKPEAKTVEENLAAAHARSNALISKMLASEASSTKVSDDSQDLTIPDFLKRA